ncbi:S66 peptidase family protein [Sedimentibacter sp. MB31-C6]|uniref:S66 peptidase family protein n=1 Tax=Sedimentibacter sp. MB31-C6 TaxID=3109366 RepID=UPI002DDCA739|nr:LD-carboxypeptidase [Sedimentibacter sp. MB36-C1]WSI02900.1 LD-carboxypeptidase [Sedimentibacter sp. MB36-C1]
MIFPNKLKKGDTIAIIAPSSPVTNKEADLCKNFVEDMGYKVKMGKCTYESIHGYSAGTGYRRAEDINEMFADKEVKAIWCIRGGDTSSHIMDKLDFEMIKNNPKIFVGYSDVTNLNVNFNQNCGFITFHGPMVKSNMLNAYDGFTKKSFEKVLNMQDEYILENPIGEDFKVMIDGTAEGTIIGGNLSLLVSMIGTPYEVDTKGKILFIEDVDENVRRLDRMMYQLKYSNKLEDATGIIFGDFTDCINEKDEDYTVIEMLKDVLEDYKKPVMYNVKSGHCFPMLTIPLGSNCFMDTKLKLIKFNI